VRNGINPLATFKQRWATHSNYRLEPPPKKFRVNLELALLLRAVCFGLAPILFLSKNVSLGPSLEQEKYFSLVFSSASNRLLLFVTVVYAGLYKVFG